MFWFWVATILPSMMASLYQRKSPAEKLAVAAYSLALKALPNIGWPATRSPAMVPETWVPWPSHWRRGLIMPSLP